MSRLFWITFSVCLALFQSVETVNACAPGDPYESLTPIHGDKCSVSYPQSEYKSVSLFQASDLGAGFVLQPLGINNVCSQYAMSVVYDCNDNNALVFGGVDLAWGVSGKQDRYNKNNPLIRLINQVKEKADNGQQLTLMDISKRATHKRLHVNSLVNLNNDIEVDGQRINLRCACNLYYPELSEGMQ